MIGSKVKMNLYEEKMKSYEEKKKIYRVNYIQGNEILMIMVATTDCKVDVHA